MPNAGWHVPMRPVQTPAGYRRSFTLVELLVVMAIMAVLMAVALPKMRPAMESRRIREAARGVSVYCGSARTRALESGRACGVMIQRLDGLPQCAVELSQAEVPAAYGGATVDARAQLEVTGAAIQATLTGVGSLDGLVSPGDLMQLNYQGPLYTITGVSGTTLTLGVNLSGGGLVPWTTGSPMSVPYKIYRQPRPRSVMPLRLPAGAVIDLQFSGTDSNPALFSGGTGPVVIMFSPGGGIDRVYLGGAAQPVTEPIYLLVGKREAINAGDGMANWQDPKNLWVVLNPRTGLLTTSPVVPGDDIATSRAIARRGRGMGGR